MLDRAIATLALATLVLVGASCAMGDTAGSDRHRSEDVVLDGMSFAAPVEDTSKVRLSDGGTAVAIEWDGALTADRVTVPDGFRSSSSVAGLLFAGPDPRREGQFCTIVMSRDDDDPSMVDVLVDCGWTGDPTAS